MTQRELIKTNFSPLRYPGGKGKLCAYIKSVIEQNDLFDCEYVEPYAGGAAVAIELLAHEYVLSIHINDISRPIFAFWNSLLNNTDELCKLISDTRVTIKNWDRQKEIFRHSDDQDDLDLGFATFFLNRTNRSGILNAGIIGGRDQISQWGIDARYNKKNLLSRIKMIGNFRDRISLTNMDAVELINVYSNQWRDDSLIYFDPPYYNKGKHLYYDYYKDADHMKIARSVGKMKRHKWIVSYDNHIRIRELFHSFRSATYDIGYSARDHKDGREIMFFSSQLSIPEASTNMKIFQITESHTHASAGI